MVNRCNFDVNNRVYNIGLEHFSRIRPFHSNLEGLRPGVDADGTIFNELEKAL